MGFAIHNKISFIYMYSPTCSWRLEKALTGELFGLWGEVFRIVELSPPQGGYTRQADIDPQSFVLSKLHQKQNFVQYQCNNNDQFDEVLLSNLEFLF